MIESAEAKLYTYCIMYVKEFELLILHNDKNLMVKVTSRFKIFQVFF